MNWLFVFYSVVSAFLATNLYLAVKDKSKNKGYSSWTRGTITDIVDRTDKRVMLVSWTDNKNRKNYVYEQTIRNKKPIDQLIKKYIGQKMFLMFDNSVNPPAVMPYQNYNNRIIFNAILLSVFIFFMIRAGSSISS